MNDSSLTRLPLDTAERCFSWLVTGPQPLSLDGRSFPHFPDRKGIPLDEVRRRLLRRRCPQQARDAVWASLVRRSRVEGAAWTLACTGMALPALRGVSRWLIERYPGDPFDVEAEVLSGFLHALARVDLRRPRVMLRLRWAAYRAGHAALSEALSAPVPVGSVFRSEAPPPPWGHPDLVLVRAVGLGVLTRTEADLIGSTRLEQRPITDWAEATGLSVDAAYKARHRAEARLVAHLHDRLREADPQDPVADCALSDTPTTTSSTPHRRSRSVTTQAEESSLSMSNSAATDGLSHCGGTTASRQSTSVEVS